MHITDKNRMHRGPLTILLALLMVGVGGVAVKAASDNTIHVNVGEAVTLTVDGVPKLFIADPAVADPVPLSDKEINIIGKRMGVTTLTIVYADKPTQVYRIEVGNDAVTQLLQKVVDSKSITVRTVGDTVIVDGYVNDELEAQRVAQVLAIVKGQQVLNLLEVRKPRQVRVRTRIAEVDSTAIKQIGLQWFGPNGQVQYAMQFVGGGSIVHGLIPTASEFGSEGSSISPSTVTLTALLELLITKNYARLLSEPTLTTLSGKEASFLVGQEIPIVQQLPQSFTVEFKEVGVRMKIKPTVDSQNQINTTVHAEVTQITGNSVLGIPILGAKTADTALQVKDGQTVVIGGLLGNNISRDFFRKLPWLGDIPGLGLLFRNKEMEKDQTEVLFFMTPEIIKDVDLETANAAQTPLMKDWNGNWNAKILKVPKKGYDWSLANPQGSGFVDPAKEPKAKSASGTATNAPAQSAEPSTNFTPARPAGN